MHIEYLGEFTELVDCLSFSKAAKRLHISQPALSNHVAELECEFGATLISRNRPIAPTAAGVCFYEAARQALEILKVARERCRKLNTVGVSHLVTVKMPYGGSYSKRDLLKLVSAFRKAYPFVEVRMISGSHVYLLDEMAAGNIDCGCIPAAASSAVWEHQDCPQIEFIPATVDRLGIWLSPGNPLGVGKSVAVEQLEGASYPLPSGAQFEELRQSAMSFFELHDVHPAFRFVHVETFEEFLFGIADDDILLGVPSGNNGVSGALDNKCFIPFEPTVEHKVFLVLRKDPADPTLALFRSFALSWISEHLRATLHK